MVRHRFRSSRHGSLAEAMRASSAVPFLFAPVDKGAMLLADGGLVDNLPTDVARELGAVIVIAVDVTSPLLEKEQIRTFLEVVDQSISRQMRSPYDFGLFHGGGAEISMDTLIGPLRAAAGWGQGGRFHFYLSLGPSF